MADDAPAYLTGPRPNPHQRPATAIDALVGRLRAVGVTRLYAATCARYGVLSVAYGVTVWTNGRLLWWQAKSGEMIWPAADPEGAARRLTSLTTDTATPPSSAQPPGDLAE